MKYGTHKGVRNMHTEPTAEGGRKFTIQGYCTPGGMWSINGDPCEDDITAVRLVTECLGALAHARDKGKWVEAKGKWIAAA